MDRTERAAHMALGAIFGFEPAAGLRLIKELGCAEAAFSADRQRLREILGPAPNLLGQLRKAALEKALHELDEISDAGYSFICHSEEGYPSLLLECPDAPIGLYLRSDSPATEIFSDERPKIAVVGTRDISHYGSEWCVRLVETLSLCDRKPLIVSGLALGTDITAHRTALECGLPTVGVMATGIDTVYPHQHEWAAEQISSAPASGLVTDYPRGSIPKAVNFVRRNRIIAGICQALVLVESSIRGGGMISARLAASYDREVYALPGRIDDRRSQGCNLLIRERSAEPITDMNSLVIQLGLGSGGPPRKDADIGEIVLKLFSASPEAERMAKLSRLIKDRRGIGLDELTKLSGFSYADTSSMVRMLECEGLVVTDLFGNCRINPKKINFAGS